MVGLMLIYCEHRNSRIDYAIKTFCSLAGIKNAEVTLDETVFSNEKGIKLNYSSKKFDNSFEIIPHALLSETGTKNQELKIEKWEETPCFFKTSEGKLPFDIFAASFWLLTRYEEYLPHTADNHSRFSGKDSFLFKNNLLLQPLIDQWGKKLVEVLKFETEKKSIVKKLTIDVDNAFAFAHKGTVRSLGGSVRNLLKSDFGAFKDRIKVARGKMKDPFDTYEYILEKAKENNVDLKFFFLLGDKGKNDTNLSHQTKELREKIKHISQFAECGIHPSYQSFLDENKVREEVSRLENIIGKKVTISRQHFLRMQLPKSYQILINCEITEDHTMGFADEPGYRAGTSQPFYWYDLSNEKATNLRIFPFVMMDATLKRYLGLSPEKALEYSQNIYDSLKNTGGNFTLLWHNESVNDYWKWKGWQRVFEGQLKIN